MILRIPVIPEFNASAEEMRAMARFAAGLKQGHTCHLLPYHAFAAAKYRCLGMRSRLPSLTSPPVDLMEAFLDIWIDAGIDAQVGG
jgi:pyruvate formate lyase activating enzyme